MSRLGRRSAATTLKQIGLAAHSFHDQASRFPPGYLGPVPSAPFSGTGNQAEFIGALVYLLPYIEQQAVYSQIDTNLKLDVRGRAWWTSRNTAFAAQQDIGPFVCPSVDRHRYSQGQIFLTNLYNPSGSERRFTSAPLVTGKVSLTHFVGVAGYLGNLPGITAQRYEGLFSNRTKHRFADISDGSSNVLLLGESTAGKVPGLLRSWSWIGVGMMATVRGLDNQN